MNDCIFCKIVNGEIPSKKVYEDDNVIAIMDVNPKVDGHTLVIPKKHVREYTDLTDEEMLSCSNTPSSDIFAPSFQRGREPPELGSSWRLPCPPIPPHILTSNGSQIWKELIT